MPELNVWIRSVPQTWFKLQDKFWDTGTGNVIVDARRSVRVNDPSGPQVDSYAIRVFRYLQEMFDRVAGACGGSAFKTVSVHADTPEARWVTNTDLLCYVMQTTNMSWIPRQIEAHRQFGDHASC